MRGETARAFPTSTSTSTRARTRMRARMRTRTRRAAAVTTTLDEAGTMVSHAVHATSSEPSYEVLKLGLSMTEATSAAGRGEGRREARRIAWVASRRRRGDDEDDDDDDASTSGVKASVEEFWARVNAEAVRQLFPSVTPGEETARLLRSLYFKAERAPLSETVGGLATCLLLTRLMERGVTLTTRDGRVVREVRAMRAPRPLKGGLFANPEIVYHGETGPRARRVLLPHELDESIAAKLGTRAAFHQTCIVRVDDDPDANADDSWFEIDIAGPALDNYEFTADGAVPLCVAPVSARERSGWTQSVDELIADVSEADFASASAFADRAGALVSL